MKRRQALPMKTLLVVAGIVVVGRDGVAVGGFGDDAQAGRACRPTRC